MPHIDVTELVRTQLARDEVRCARYPGLFEHKVERMRPSPLAFLRGSAPLFYSILRSEPDLARGPSGKGWITGDLHLENFGAYRPASFAEEVEKKHAARENVVFDLNDFDEAVIGPWYLDVLRLATSFLLAGRELSASGADVIELAEALIESHAEHACAERSLPKTPRPIEELLAAVAGRSRARLLGARTKVVHGKRKFVRGPRYRDIPTAIEQQVRASFAKYTEHLPPHEELSREQTEILDVAFRVAGTGSLGSFRVGVLTKGKGGQDGAWIFDVKEQGNPCAEALLGRQTLRGAARVVAAIECSLARPPRSLGTTKLAGRSMLVRRLTPQEDKLMLSKLRSADLLPLARYLGALTGTAHRRGATSPPKKPWNKVERGQVIEHAITFAGLHEAAYLAMCRFVAAKPTASRRR